jgi:PAS domain S-box-containing protein
MSEHHALLQTMAGRIKMRLAHDFENANLNLNLFQAIVEQAADAVIFADCEGAIRLWNHGAETVFGYSASEVLGTSLDVIIPERFRHSHWHGFENAIEKGQTKYKNKVLTTESIHKDGRKLYVDLSYGLVKADNGAVVGALAMGRNCTDRRLLEATLRARIVELEENINSRPRAG